MKKGLSALVGEGDTTAPELYLVEQIEVALIDPSPANRRKFHEGDPKLKELADSIEAQGLLQAVVIRQSPAADVNPNCRVRFELVAGERRYRAFKLKGWKTIPAVVRTLSDKEAHDITTTENLQREDLSPIEEAESIQVLLDDGRDAKEIADRIGKPISWVLRRARIADLSPKWLKAIADQEHPLSKWSATHLELIARYDHEKQDKLFEDCYGRNYESDNALLTVRELEKRLNADMLNLSGAPWKPGDETLLPAEGACTQCQKRTGCQPDLFEPIEETKGIKGDRCLNKECWGKKLIAYHEINIKKAREQNSNLVLIDKADYRTRTLQGDHPWTKSTLSDSWNYDSAKKDTRGAIPAYVIDGPGAGKIKYLVKSGRHGGTSARPIGEDGNPAPKSMKEKRESLEKRRIIRFITKLMMILKGEDPDLTGSKEKSGAGTCRICGCTENNPCIDDNSGDTCSWVEPDLCSACADKVEKKSKKGKKSTEPVKVDPRIAIAEKFSSVEVFALVGSFGARPCNDFDKQRYEVKHQQRYQTFSAMGIDAIQQIALFGAFDNIVDVLRGLTYSQKPEIELPNLLCSALKLDHQAIYDKCVAEIPEPKAWAKQEEEEKLSMGSSS